MSSQSEILLNAVLLNEVFPPAGENPYKVDGEQIKQRAKLLQKYLTDEQKELQALYALQALMVQMEQPASECLSSRSHYPQLLPIFSICSHFQTIKMFVCGQAGKITFQM